MKRVATDLVIKCARRLIQSYAGNKEDKEDKDSSDLRARSRSPSRTPDGIYRDPPQPAPEPTPESSGEYLEDILRCDLGDIIWNNALIDQPGYTDFDSQGVNTSW